MNYERSVVGGGVEGSLDAVDDAVVAGAAAEVAGHDVADVGVAGDCGVGVEEGGCPGGAGGAGGARGGRGGWGGEGGGRGVGRSGGGRGVVWGGGGGRAGQRAWRGAGAGRAGGSAAMPWARGGTGSLGDSSKGTRIGGRSPEVGMM